MTKAELATPLLREFDHEFPDALTVDVIDVEGGLVEGQTTLPPGTYRCYRNYDHVEPGKISLFIEDPRNPRRILRLQEGED